MAFSLPNFNLVMDTWNVPDLPSADPPTFTNVPVQLYIGSRGILDITPSDQLDWVPPIYLRVPETSYGSVKEAWVFKIDNGHGSGYYKARWKEWVHLGFPNQYYAIICEQCADDGSVPFFRQVTY